MNSLELLAMMPVLILALGSTIILMVGAWYPHWRHLVISAALVALLAALWAGLHHPPVPEVTNLYSTGPYAQFFTVLWALLAALVLLLSLRYGVERRFDGGVYCSLILFAAVGMSLLSAATSLIGIFIGLEAYTMVAPRRPGLMR